MVIAGLHAAGGPENLGEHFLGLVGQRALLNRPHGLIDRVSDALELDAIVIDYSVSGAGVAVARLADASGIDDQPLPHLEHVRLMSMADANDIGIDVLQPASPEVQIRVSILVERVAGRGV